MTVQNLGSNGEIYKYSHRPLFFTFPPSFWGTPVNLLKLLWYWYTMIMLNY